jgi:hypothetical protein
MNALPIWDAEQRLEAAPVPNPLIADSTDDSTDDSTATAPAAGPGGHRGAALAAALQSLEASATPSDAVELLLAAIDAADDAAGIVRVDRRDAVLQQRIARIVSGANLPSRGPGTRARDILGLLGEHRPA